MQLRTVGSFLVVVAFIVGLVGCTPSAVQYGLTISSTEGGEITTPGEGTFSYEEGTVVPLLVFPYTDYHFVNWTGDVDTIPDINAASTIITMNGNYRIIANFEEAASITCAGA
jgi:hypothetical protein